MKTEIRNIQYTLNQMEKFDSYLTSYPIDIEDENGNDITIWEKNYDFNTVKKYCNPETPQETNYLAYHAGYTPLLILLAFFKKEYDIEKEGDFRITFEIFDSKCYIAFEETPDINDKKVTVDMSLQYHEFENIKIEEAYEKLFQSLKNEFIVLKLSEY